MSPVHMGPEEAVRAHEILAAKTSIAIHHGTFQLADEGLDTPKKRLMACAPDESFLVLKNGQFADIPVKMTIDKHTLALVSIVGSSLDVLGALYLAYDLLGGEHGPLRTLTRGVTYGALFGIGYGLALGPVFGLASGVAHGITLAWEFSRASRHGPKPGFWYDTAMSAIRGAGFALGAAYLYGAAFGATFGALSTVGQVVAYRVGIRPTIDYQPATRPRLTKLQFLAAVNRTVGYAVAGYLSALVAHAAGNALMRRAESRTGDRSGHGDRERMHALHRMECGSCAREAHGCLRSWLDPHRLRAAIRPVLAGAARREYSLKTGARSKRGGCRYERLYRPAATGHDPLHP